MSITALPVPPTRSDPVNFSARADDFLSALPTFVTEANQLQADVNAKQVTASNAATNAAASAAAANASSTASVWVSGTTYAVGNVRYSPITYLSYRRKTAGAGTTDPSADPTNWELINGTGNVDLTSTQTLSNKTFNSGSNWNGNAVPVANGGTGATTAAGAFNNIKQAATYSYAGVVELADSSEVTDGNNNTTVVTPAGVKGAMNAVGNPKMYACRAWGKFNHNSVNGAGNISSIVSNGTGNYTVNFSTAMPDVNYSAVITAGYQSGYDGNIVFFACEYGRTTSSVSFYTGYVSGTAAFNYRGSINLSNMSIAIFR